MATGGVSPHRFSRQPSSRSRAASGVDDAVVARDGALNSVIVEAGAELNGDIIIIDDSKGDKTIVTE